MLPSSGLALSTPATGRDPTRCRTTSAPCPAPAPCKGAVDGASIPWETGGIRIVVAREDVAAMLEHAGPTVGHRVEALGGIGATRYAFAGAAT